MTVVELHPEELLDRAEEGALTPSEQERLDAHLAKCEVCRFERDARADFAAEMEAEERPSKVGLLVAGAMRVSVPPAAGKAPSTPPRRRRVARRTAVLLVAAAITMAGAAGANGWVGQAWHEVVGPPPPPVPVETSPSAPTAHAHAVAPVRPPPLSVPETPEPSAPPAPESGSLERRWAGEPAVARGQVAVVPATAAELFDQANEARRRGDHTTALTRYRELQARAPRSEEAKTSLVTMGRLELDEGNLADALNEFEAYLRDGGGELREEAMSGRARTLERLGRTESEAEAWRALMAAYPGSSYAVHARARLAALGPR